MSDLVLPKGTHVAVIDPQVDFMNVDGVYARKYGKDAEPLAAITPELCKMVDQLKGKTIRMLFKSFYTENQFGVEGLEKLCTTDSGCKSVIDEYRFNSVFKKFENSMLSAPCLNDKFINELSHLILTGITITTCIEKSREAMAKRFPDLHIVIPLNVVAARLSQKKKADILIKQWRNDPQMSVVDKWQDIVFAD
ncbi:isochorismatase family protein [Candidatus Peribacteria bacterium]|nr:isochorismatase family protein [Candidatus Peribacteria bacterium]